MKVLFLVPYPFNYGPSQRFRLEIYLPFLEQNNIEYDYEEFLSLKYYQILYKQGKFLSKFIGICKGYLRRLWLFRKMHIYDFVFIQREAALIGPPIFEWLISKIWRKKIIYDFDDAIWIPNYTAQNARFHKIKWYSKVSSIIKWSHCTVCGNAYLIDYARKYSNRVQLIPTIVDTEKYHHPIKRSKNERFTIGWTGSISTLHNLDPLIVVFERLAKQHKFDLKIISNVKPDFSLPNMIFVPWNLHTEIAALNTFDIGIMPLKEDYEFAKGKCGFKTIQYMAMAVPALVSPVGVNLNIVDHGNNGFICNSINDWEKLLDKILREPSILEPMKSEARQKIIDYYSLAANKNKFLSLFTN